MLMAKHPHNLSANPHRRVAWRKSQAAAGKFGQAFRGPIPGSNVGDQRPSCRQRLKIVRTTRSGERGALERFIELTRISYVEHFTNNDRAIFAQRPVSDARHLQRRGGDDTNFAQCLGKIGLVGVSQFQQHVAVFLDLLAALAQLFFRLPELIVRPQQFGGAFGDSPFERRVQGSDLALGPLMVGNLSLGRTEQRRLGFLSLAQVAGDQHEHGFAVAFNRGGVDPPTGYPSHRLVAPSTRTGNCHF